MNKLSVIDGETLLDMDLNAPRFCVQNFLPQGLSILGGAPKMEKLLEFMKQKEYFHGTSTELANQFNEYANLNMSVKGMKQMMNRWRYSLREQGLTFHNHRSNGLRSVEVSYSLPVTEVTQVTHETQL